MPKANALVDYVDADTGEIIETLEYYDPGLDENSSYALRLKKFGQWKGPHIIYGCGRPMRRSGNE